MPPINETLVRTIRRELRSRKDATRARGAAAYMKVALPFLGVAMPEVRRIAKAAFRAQPIATLAEYRATVSELFFNAKHQEERYAALAVAAERGCRGFQRASVLPLYRSMITTAAWWDLVDDVSCRVGDVLGNAPEVTAKTLLGWARGDDLWLRRAAIICQRKRKGETDLELLYACIEPSLSSPEFFLRKGIGWALRSLAWHDAPEARRYVREHADRLSPLSQREALKNLG